MTPEQLSWLVDDTVVRALQGVKGVSQIDRIGGVEREIRIALDPDRLLAYGITAGDVNRQLRATNVDLAGGRGDIGGREQAIRTLAGKQTLEELAATMITLPRGRKVRLDQLGTVTDANAEPRTFAALDNAPVVAFAISRAKGASDTVVAADIAKKIEELKKANPNVELKLIDTMVTYTLGAYRSTMTSLIEGAVLAIIVVFIFLRDLRATIIAAIALPLSIIPAFWALDAGGLLARPRQPARHHDRHRHPGGRRHRRDREHRAPHAHGQERLSARRWKPPTRSALAVIAITLTIIAVFVPVSFMGGIAGQYLQAVRTGGGRRGVLLAAGGAPHHAAARRLLHAQQASRQQGGLDTQGLHVAGALVGCAPLQDGGAGAGHPCSLHRQLLPPALRLPAARRTRAAPLLAIELPPGSRIDDTKAATDAMRPPDPRAVRTSRACSSIGGTRDGRRRGAAQGDAGD